MATFVSLINWTQEGIKGFKDSVARADAFSDLVAKSGGKVVCLYWTLGAFTR